MNTAMPLAHAVTWCGHRIYTANLTQVSLMPRLPHRAAAEWAVFLRLAQ